MKFSLIVCTYMRAKPLLTLLNSVKEQTLYPDEIIIVDGSTDNKTKIALISESFKNLKYYLVSDKDRGLTKQRNFGISKVSKSTDIVCFLDDDIVLTKDYFKSLINTYRSYPNAGGIGGYIINESSKWEKVKEINNVPYNFFYFDGYMKILGLRHKVRKKLGLSSNTPPCIMPTYSNGFSVGHLPPTGKTYPGEYFMGGGIFF